jgi:prolyl-tRNA synthetase
MKLSRYFLPLLKENPKEAQIVSHQLMLRAGMVRQESAGIYSWLPLGLAVLRNIEQIVREEIERAGGVAMLMPTIQSADLWRESGRYDDYGKEMLRITDRHGRDMLYGPTNEEMITSIFKQYVRSYKSLPLNLYHIQWKFRDEVRPRFGVMRGREFLMKDAYTFDIDEQSARKAYHRMFVTYLNCFERLGLKAIPMKADTGPIGGDLSHEFIILADTGESQVFCHRDLVDMPAPGLDVDFEGDLQAHVSARTSLYAATDEMHDEARFAKEVPADKQVSARGIEVGHIFYFGDKYSKPFGANVMNAEGKQASVHMGSHGIGISRLVAAVIEASHDEQGIIWPTSIAPFHAGIIHLRPGDAACEAMVRQLESALEKAGITYLTDDTSERAGAKFASMDLIGLPFSLTIGPKTAAQEQVEFKIRASGEKQVLSINAAVDAIAQALRA